ncbi:DUF2380 domain-containing protein [Myxococcaceae bacterium GXIMD 01537]
MTRALSLLACALLVCGCASVVPSHGRGFNPRGPPRLAMGSALARGPQARPPRPPPAPAPTPALSELTGATPTSPEASEGAARTRESLHDALAEVRQSAASLSASLRQLAARTSGLGHNEAFRRYTEFGVARSLWLEGALEDVSLLSSTARDVAAPDMEAALLRMAGPRLQASLLSSLLLAAWLDFLHLADAVLEQCPFYSAERLFMDLHRVQTLLEPSFSALASLEPGALEPTAAQLPGLMENLSREHASLRAAVRVAAERAQQAVVVAQLVEALSQASSMKFFLPRLPPAAPVTLGVGLLVGPNGVVTGSRLVLSAEWVERVRELIRAGVLSAPVVSSAVRIHAMAQADPKLPPGLRDTLGDGPEVQAMHETGRAGAGMAEPPRHHVLPREHREWFEQRGFTGPMDIDQFCVLLEAADHQAIHGGGNWKLGRMWPGEWNRMIMKALTDAERRSGRTLTRNEILNIVAERMKGYDIAMSFISGKRR